MVSVGIIVTERCQASSVFTIVDMLVAANFAATQLLGESEPPFNLRLLGLRTKATSYNGCALMPLEPLAHVQRPDILLLPGAFEAVLEKDHADKILSRLSELYPRLREWHAAGTVIGSVCTGSFLVARAGLSVGRTLTCHWASSKTAIRLFPSETFVPEKMLIDHGDLISAGGALSVSQLVLYLIQRFHGRELALATAKLMLVEPSYECQSRFAIFSPSKTHGDSLVTTLQNQIEQELNLTIDFHDFAATNGMTVRHLNRRFKKATGETPLSYQQRMRIENVKTGLEMTKKRLNTLVWEVGYEDLTSFRRLFKRYTGLTMQEYRSRFAI